MADERPRDSGGKYVNSVSRGNVLDALRNGGYVSTTRDVADTVDVSPDTARRHLNELCESGIVNRKQVGARGVVWWVAARDYDELDNRADDLKAGKGVSFEQWLAEDA